MRDARIRDVLATVLLVLAGIGLLMLGGGS